MIQSAHLCRLRAGSSHSHKCIAVATALSRYPKVAMLRNLPLRDRWRRTAGSRLKLEKLAASKAQRTVPAGIIRVANEPAFHNHASPADATDSQPSCERRTA